MRSIVQPSVRPRAVHWFVAHLIVTPTANAFFLDADAVCSINKILHCPCNLLAIKRYLWSAHNSTDYRRQVEISFKLDSAWRASSETRHLSFDLTRIALTKSMSTDLLC